MASTATAVQTAMTLSKMAATAAEKTGAGLSNGGGAGSDGQPKGRELFTDEVLELNCLHQTCYPPRDGRMDSSYAGYCGPKS